MNDLQCPKCKSETVGQLGDSLVCTRCGYSENLYDYPCHDPRWEIDEDLLPQYDKVHNIPDRVPTNKETQQDARLNYLTEQVQLIRNSNRKRNPNITLTE